MRYPITTQRQLRRLFWETFPNLNRRRIVDFGGPVKQHVCDTRCTWCDWLDGMSKDGQISQELVHRATL